MKNSQIFVNDKDFASGKTTLSDRFRLYNELCFYINDLDIKNSSVGSKNCGVALHEELTNINKIRK